MLIDIVVNGNCVLCGDKLTGTRIFICERCERRHRNGKWVDNDIPDSTLSKCTECGFDLGAYTFDYCPKCGAYMKGENNDR